MPAPKGHEPYAGCEKGGRPRKYSSADIDKLADEFLIWMKDEKNIWFKDFCLDRDIDPDFMAEWAQENEKFNGVYKTAKHRQESRLINGGLCKGFNSAIVKLVLSNVHGYSDKQESKISGDLPSWLQQSVNQSKELIDNE